MTVDLLLYDTGAILGEEEPVLREEVERLLGEAEISVRWLDADEVYHTNSGRLPLRAMLLDKEPTCLELREEVMGVTPGEGDGSVFLFYPAILRTLDIEPGSVVLRTRRGREMRARAIGRVLVHELVHSIAPARHHTSSGLMRSRFTRQTLTDPRMNLDPGSRRALVAGLHHLSLVARRN